MFVIIEILFGWWLYNQVSQPDRSSGKRYVEFSKVYTESRDKVDHDLRDFSHAEGEELKAVSALKWIIVHIATSLNMVARRDDYQDWQYKNALARADIQAGSVLFRLRSLVRSIERTGVNQPTWTSGDFKLLSQQAQQLRDLVIEHFKLVDAPNVAALADLAAELAERTWEPRKRRI